MSKLTLIFLVITTGILAAADDVSLSSSDVPLSADQELKTGKIPAVGPFPEVKLPPLPPMPSLPTLPPLPPMPTLPSLPTLPPISSFTFPSLPSLPPLPAFLGGTKAPVVVKVKDDKVEEFDVVEEQVIVPDKDNFITKAPILVHSEKTDFVAPAKDVLTVDKVALPSKDVVAPSKDVLAVDKDKISLPVVPVKDIVHPATVHPTVAPWTFAPWTFAHSTIVTPIKDFVVPPKDNLAVDKGAALPAKDVVVPSKDNVKEFVHPTIIAPVKDVVVTAPVKDVIIPEKDIKYPVHEVVPNKADVPVVAKPAFDSFGPCRWFNRDGVCVKLINFTSCLSNGYLIAPDFSRCSLSHACCLTSFRLISPDDDSDKKSN